MQPVIKCHSLWIRHLAHSLVINSNILGKCRATFPTPIEVFDKRKIGIIPVTGIYQFARRQCRDGFGIAEHKPRPPPRPPRMMIKEHRRTVAELGWIERLWKSSAVDNAPGRTPELKQSGDARTERQAFNPIRPSALLGITDHLDVPTHLVRIALDTGKLLHRIILAGGQQDQNRLLTTIHHNIFLLLTIIPMIIAI